MEHSTTDSTQQPEPSVARASDAEVARQTAEQIAQQEQNKLAQAEYNKTRQVYIDQCMKKPREIQLRMVFMAIFDINHQMRNINMATGDAVLSIRETLGELLHVARGQEARIDTLETSLLDNMPADEEGPTTGDPTQGMNLDEHPVANINVLLDELPIASDLDEDDKEFLETQEELVEKTQSLFGTPIK